MRKRLKAKPMAPRRRSSRKLFILASISLIIFAAVFGLYEFDKKIRPLLVNYSEMSVRAKMNTLISESVKRYSEENGLNSDDFYVKSVDSEGKIYSLSVNTVLVNDLCGNLSVDISEGLANLEVEKVPVSLGKILGISLFMNVGPVFSVHVLPKGSVSVDYSSEFVSAGINQINFSVWLDVSSVVEIMSLFGNSPIILDRKVALVNTIFSGEIPSMYFNYTPDGGK